MTQEDKIKSDFKFFLMIVWKHLNLPNPTPVQFLIADYLQNGPKRKVIQAFRGVGKSWITAAYVVWRLYCDPQLNILVVSASKARADAFSIFTQRLINEIPILAELRAGPNTTRKSMVSWDVGPAESDQNPSVQSVGIYGQITGYRADEIVADDIEIPSNSDTQDAREKLAERVKEFDSIIKPLNTSRITYLGTPQTEMSLYNKLADRGYSIRIWPARYPDGVIYSCNMALIDPHVQAYMEAHPDCKGKPIDMRFPEEDLTARELSNGHSTFALQFMLDTSLSDDNRYPLKARDLIIYSCQGEMLPDKIEWAADSRNSIKDDELKLYGLNADRFYRPAWVSPNFSHFDTCIMSVDIAGMGADETVATVIKSLNGKFYVCSCKGYLDGYTTKTLTALAETAKQYKVQRIYIEDNMGGGMFSKLLQPIMTQIYPCSIENVTSTKSKELRIIDTLEPLLNQHRIIFDPSVTQNLGNMDMSLIRTDSEDDGHLNYNLIFQMTRMTRAKGAVKHDDKIDSLCIGMMQVKDQAQLDQDVVVAENNDRLMRAEDEYFYSGGKNGERYLMAMMMGLSFTPTSEDTRWSDAADDVAEKHPDMMPDAIRAMLLANCNQGSILEDDPLVQQRRGNNNFIGDPLIRQRRRGR